MEDLRLLAVHRALRRGELAKQIARRLGFAHVTHLSRAIRMRYGISLKSLRLLPVSCDKLKKAALADGLKPGAQYESCFLGWTKVAYFEGDKKGLVGTKPDDYHWAREDSFEHWSHKLGNEMPRTTDGSGKEITDPSNANWDFPRIKHKLCGYLCVPPKI
jgi:hypothetical protein